MVFVAVPGTRDDGRRYIPEAVCRGAAAVVSEAPVDIEGVPVLVVPNARRALAELASSFYGDPWRGAHTVAVTGTAGKSTTVEWLLHILRSLGERVEAVGSLHRPGIPEGAPGLTTPGPVVLHRTLRAYRDAGAQTLILEVTSHAIEQERVAGIDFGAAVLTSLGRDHLDYHRTLEDYWATKRRIFTGLGARARAFLPADRRSEAFGSGLSASVTRFGEGGEVTVVADGPFGGGSYPARLVTPAGTVAFQMHLPGPGMAQSAAAAAAYALFRGADVHAVASALETLAEIPGRLERLDVGGVRVLIDYGHNPPGIATAMAAGREVAGTGRLTVILGAPGHRDRGKLPEMGRLLASADRVILTSESPEGESADELADLMAQGVLEAGTHHPEKVMDRQKAVEAALGESQPGDVVLLLGRGRERFQDFGHVVLLGSDRELVLRAENTLGSRRSRP